MLARSMLRCTKRRLTVSLKYEDVNLNAAIDTTEHRTRENKIVLRGDFVNGSEGGVGGKMRFPTSRPTRNIDRYPSVSYVI